MSGPYPFRDWVMRRCRIDLPHGAPSSHSGLIKLALYRAMRADPGLDFHSGPGGQAALAQWVHRHSVLGTSPSPGTVREHCRYVWQAYRATFKRHPSEQDRSVVEAFIAQGGT